MYGLDLFSGIGGITKALEGYVTPVAYCENDRYAQAVLLSRMSDRQIPTAPIWDDVRTLRGDMLPSVEIIYGGFPCQDISVAGRGGGLDGERSGLFFEITRLTGDILPAFVFLENVPAITSRGGLRVAGEFAALRYDCRWGMLRAADVGAPHLRERWFLVAHAQNGRRQSSGHQNAGALREPNGPGLLADSSGEFAGDGSDAARGGQPVRGRPQGKDGQPTRPRQSMGEELADAGSERLQTPGPSEARNGFMQRAQLGGKGYLADAGTQPIAGIEERRKGRQEQNPLRADWWSTEPNVGRVAHGIPSRVDRLRALGNSVVSLQAREAFERLMGLQ